MGANYRLKKAMSYLNLESARALITWNTVGEKIKIDTFDDGANDDVDDNDDDKDDAGGHYNNAND